jgi:hypothetical protein
MRTERDIEFDPTSSDLRSLEEELFARVAYTIMERKVVGVLVHSSEPEQPNPVLTITVAVLPWHLRQFKRMQPRIKHELLQLVVDGVRVEVTRMPFHKVLMLLAIRFLQRAAPPEAQTA